MELRRTLLLRLDDLLAVTREFLCKEVSRSGLDRCLRRHGVGNLNALKPSTPKEPHKAFKSYTPGYLHMDVKYLPQMADETDRRYLFVAIDRATRWVFVAIKSGKTAASSEAVSAVLLAFGATACCHFDAAFLASLSRHPALFTRMCMRKFLITSVLASAVALVPAMAGAKGCLKGAAVGGVAGHVAGHHGLIGAAAGCAIEHHREKVRDKAAVQPPIPSTSKDATPMSTDKVAPAK